MVQLYKDIDADEQIGMYFKDGDIVAPEQKGLLDSSPLNLSAAALQVLPYRQAVTMVLAKMGRFPFVWTRETVLGVLPAMPTISGQLRLNVHPTRNTPTL